MSDLAEKHDLNGFSGYRCGYELREYEAARAATDAAGALGEDK